MDIQDKRILVAGGAGFIGSHIVDHLLAAGAAEAVIFGGARRENESPTDQRVRRAEGSVTDMDSLRRGLEGVDAVILLSSLWMAESAENPRTALDINVVGGFNVIEVCREMGISRLIYASSAAVYGQIVSTPIREDHPLNSTSMYGASKVAAEQFLRAYHAMYGLPCLSFRYTNVYGPRQVAKGRSASVLIRVLDRIDAGQPPIIYGDGSQSFDFIYVEDAARANILGLSAAASGEAFNIGYGQSSSINELVELLLELTGSTLRPEYRPPADTTVNTQQQVYSVEKAERLLNFRAGVPLRDGLRELVAWRRHATR